LTARSTVASLPAQAAAGARRQHRGRRVVAHQQIRAAQVEQRAPAGQQPRQPARIEPSGRRQHGRKIDQTGRSDHARQPDRRLQDRKPLADHTAMRARQILQRKNHLVTAPAQHARGQQHAVEVAHVGAELPRQQHAAHGDTPVQESRVRSDCAQGFSMVLSDPSGNDLKQAQSIRAPHAPCHAPRGRA
jgi:hypothetical protein